MNDLTEALEMISTLAAELQLAWHDREMTTRKDVDKAIREAGHLLYKHGVPSDMAVKPRGRR